MLVQMLFGDEFIIMMERLDVHLLIWKQKGRCVDLLEKSHSDVIVAVCHMPDRPANRHLSPPSNANSGRPTEPKGDDARLGY